MEAFLSIKKIQGQDEFEWSFESNADEKNNRILTWLS